MKDMNRSRGKRPKTFEEELRDFMKESDARQKEIMCRRNENVRRKRRNSRYPAYRMEGT